MYQVESGARGDVFEITLKENILGRLIKISRGFEKRRNSWHSPTQDLIFGVKLYKIRPKIQL